MIIVFSGTGNSMAVARELRSRLGGEIVTLEGDLLAAPSGHTLEVPEGEPLVWVFPVYSWGLPPVVAEFIRRSKIKGAHGIDHFMVCTCGDDIGYADNAWRKLIGRRGWNPRGAFSVRMPNTYVLMKGFDVDAPDVAADKMTAMPARVEAVAGAIRRGFAESDVVRGGTAWLKSSVVYPFFKRFCMSPLPFRCTGDCTGCGVCAARCPMENISMAGGHPQWGRSCALCLRCYHVCPSHAVAYGKETDGKGQKAVIP